MRGDSTARWIGGLFVAVAMAGCGAPADSDEVAAAPVSWPIGKVQGTGTSSPYLNQSVHVQGVVTGNFVSGLGGFFMQDATGEDDADPATSDGIFVAWDAKQKPKVRRGDRVRVEGVVAEMGREQDTQTTLQASSVEVLGRGAAPVTEFSKPLPASASWEQYEGMWLRLPKPMTVIGNDGLLRYGELVLGFNGRQFSATEVRRPGAAADALEAENLRARLIIDDNRRRENPDTFWYLPEPLSRDAPLRVGSLVHGAEGILQNFMGWRLQLTEKIARIEQAPRPAAPELPAGLRVASFNLLNWFNGDGQGRGFPTPRGAATQDEMNRQRDKLVAAIIGLKPDIAALMEVENDGFGRNSSLSQLVTALNTAWPEADYRLVDTQMGPGKDVMRVAMIYRAAMVAPVDKPATLEEGVFSELNRVPLRQAFRLKKGGAVLQVVANHFKSKRCTDATGENADQGDGQSCWAPVRAEAARVLSDWLKNSPHAKAGTVILGDLNSYAEEDPVQTFRAEGWLDALAEVGTEGAYSFNYRGYSGRLDHAFLSKALKPRLRAALEWHINADESEAFDFQRANRKKEWYAPDPYRSSDHDPLILVLDFAQP